MTADPNNTLSGEYVKIYLTDTNNNPYSGYNITVPTYDELSDSVVDSNSKTLYLGTYSGTNLIQNFRLRMWIRDTYTLDTVSETFKSKIFVKAIA